MHEAKGTSGAGFSLRGLVFARTRVRRLNTLRKNPKTLVSRSDAKNLSLISVS